MEAQVQQPEPESDPFEALGMGPDLYDYREPYRQYLPLPDASSQRDTELLEQQCRAAAHAIADADFILIGAGAGMGVDSGLAAYADVAAVPAWASRGHDYASLCRPTLLKEEPDLFYGFWGHCYNRYRVSVPHSGYSILRRWCTDVLPPPSGTALSNHWVYSSNVDGHFRRVGFEDSCLLELHGNCADNPGWFCPACSTTKDDDSAGASLRGSATPPDGYEFAVDPETMTVPAVICADGDGASTSGGFDTAWPRCADSNCNSLLRPSVHMFGEDSSALLSWLSSEEERYVEWECAMENDVVSSIGTSNCADGNADKSTRTGNDNSCLHASVAATGGTEVEPETKSTKRLVMLEIGCGLTVPSVRMEMECVLRDLTERITPDSVWKCDMCGGFTLKRKDSAVACFKCDRVTTLDAPPGEEESGGSNPSPNDTEHSGGSNPSPDATEHGGCSENVGALLVRINPQFPQNPGWEGKTIEVRAGARVALEMIDCALQEMGR